MQKQYVCDKNLISLKNEKNIIIDSVDLTDYVLKHNNRNTHILKMFNKYFLTL